MPPPPGGFGGNNFGWSSAISGDYIAVGAPNDPWYNGCGTGAVYVFRRQGRSWLEQAKLTASDGRCADQLGYTVAIDGNLIVAGAPRAEWGSCGLGPGAVYVFRRDDQSTPTDPNDDTWFQQARLTATEPEPWGLGASLAISGDVIVAGPVCGGLVEVFRWNGIAWAHEQRLLGSEWDEFGTSVDIDGNRIVVGAYYKNEGKGSAYVFVRQKSQWAEEDVLTPTDNIIPRGFGWSVGIAGGYVAVGAPGIGSSYAFVHNGDGTWDEQTRLTASDLAMGQFGYAVNINEEFMIAGGSGDPWAYVFQRDGKQWFKLHTLFGIQNSIGRSVAIDGRFATVLSYVYAVRDQRTMRDYAAFQNCFTGDIAGDPSATCQEFDLTGDGRVDLSDFEDFVGTFVGP